MSPILHAMGKVKPDPADIGKKTVVANSSEKFGLWVTLSSNTGNGVVTMMTTL